MSEFPLDLYPPADFTREDILRHIFGEVGNLCHGRKEYLFRSFWDRDECFRILQEFTDKYKAGDSTREPGLIQSPLHHVLSSAQKERERDRDKENENENEIGRFHRSDSISSTNSMESSNTRGITRGIVSPLAPQAERGSGNSNAPGNCSGELKSILRKKAMPSLPPSIRSTPLSTSPSESTSSLVSYTNNRGISPATLTSNPSVLCISPPAAVPTSQTISSLFSLSPIATPKSMGLSRSTSQSKHIGENRSPEDILAESGDLETQKSTTSESEKDVDNTELPSNLNQSTESLLTYDDGQKEEGTNDDLYIFNQEEKKSRLKLVAVALEILPVSLDQFAAMFVEENAPFNMKKYHESVKDTAVQMTDWSGQSISHDTSPAPFPLEKALLREIKFHKPVNLPGLKSTRGMKVQRYVRFGAVGLIVCSSTRLEDVPAADTFSVEDTLSVRAEGDLSVAVEITFEVRFVKSTMFRFAIEAATKIEMTKWLKDFFAVAKAHCTAQSAPGAIKYHAPSASLRLSAMRPTASSSSGLSARKRSSKNLLIDSDAPLGTNFHQSQSQSSGKGSRRGSPRGTPVRVSDAAFVQFQAQLSRKWMVVFVAYTVCLALLVGVAIDRSDRQWRTVNARLDALLSKFEDQNPIENSD